MLSSKHNLGADDSANIISPPIRLSSSSSSFLITPKKRPKTTYFGRFRRQVSFGVSRRVATRPACTEASAGRERALCEHAQTATLKGACQEKESPYEAANTNSASTIQRAVFSPRVLQAMSVRRVPFVRDRSITSSFASPARTAVTRYIYSFPSP